MLTRLSLTTAHNAQIVTLQEVKQHLYISHSDEDTYLSSLISVATNLIDGPDGIGVSIQPATYTLSLDCLNRTTQLPLEPVTAITQITLDGETVADTNYRLETDRSPQLIYSDSYQSAEPDGVKITMTVGHTVVPAELKQAALMLIGHFYRYREAVAEMTLHEVPFAVRCLLDRHRVTVS